MPRSLHLLILLAILLASVVHPAGCFTGHIGFLARLSLQDQTSVGWYWKQMAAVGLMAIDHINTRNAVLVPEAASLPRDFNVTYSICDTESDPTTGVRVALELTEEGAHALIGAVRSAVSGPASLVAGIFQIPVISFASTSKELADKTSYPSFSRTVPSDALTAKAMVSASKDLGWQSVAIFAIDDAYGRGYAQDLESSCAHFGVAVSANVRFFLGDNTTIATAISAIKLSEARVILLVTFEAELPIIVDMAHREGILGRGYTWVVADSIKDPSNLLGNMGKLTHGWISVLPATLDADKQNRFQQVWDSQDKTLLMHPLLGDVAEASELEGTLFSMHAHAYEAVWAAALALSQSYTVGPDGTHTLDRAKLNRQVREQQFTGPTGMVELDTHTGDRASRSVTYEVLSWKPAGSDGMGVQAELLTNPPLNQAVWKLTETEGLERLANADPPFWAGVGEGWVAPSDGSSCKPGEVLSGELLQCAPCPVGHRQVGAQCVQCEVGTYGPEEGMTRCIRCSLGYADQPGMSQCLRCPENTARPAGSAGVSVLECECTYGHYALNGSGQACWPCVAGATCLGGLEAPFPMPGFWTDKECALDPACPGKDMFFPCVPARKCRGGPAFECEAGFTGRMCAGVEGGFYEVGSLWRFECKSTGKWINLVGIVGVVAMWTGIKKVAASNYYALRIALLYVQITGMVSACGMRWHGIVEHVNTALSIFNFGVDFMSPHCIGRWTPVHRFYTQLLLPFIYMLLYTVSGFLWQLPAVLGLGSAPRKTLVQAITDPDFINDLIRSGLSFSILTYHTLCVNCFEAFKCRKYPDQKKYMVFLPEVECGTGEHIGMLVVAIVYFLVVLLGLPAFMLRVTHQAKREGMLHDAKTMARYGFFYVRYRTEFKWWECLVMVRRFCIALVLVVVEAPMLQAASAVVVLLVLLMAHTHSSPFIMKKVDYLEIFTLCGSILYALAGMLFYSSITEMAQGILCLEDEANSDACDSEAVLKLVIAVILLVWFGGTLLLAFTIASINISETIHQHRAHRTIKHLLHRDGETSGHDDSQSRSLSRSDINRADSSLWRLDPAESMCLVSSSANKLPLQALLSGNLLLRWSKEVKQFEEREQSRVIEEWNFVNRIVNSIPYDVTHFSASPIAETLRVLAQMPEIEDFLSFCSPEDRANLTQIVLRYCRFREDEGRRKGQEQRPALRYYSSGLLEREHRPVMICAMMTCSIEEHAKLTALLDDILAVTLPPDQRERLKPHASTHSSFSHSHDGGGLRTRGPGSRGSRESREGGEARTTVDGPQAVTPPAPSLIISPDPLRGSDGERGSSSASGSGSRVPAGQVLVSARLGTVAPAAPPAAARASAEQGDGA